MIKIAIADCAQYERYAPWIKKYDRDLDDVKLSYQLDNLSMLRKCQGLLLTGGEDVDPIFYNPDLPVKERALFGKIDRKRDEFEFKVLGEALKLKIPILAICRGCQVANVYFGGTLIGDLREKNKIHQKLDQKDRRHQIKVVPGSLLHEIVGEPGGEISSSHHQASEKPGKSLMISARSEDGVIEALEYSDKKDKGFLLLIQWHPERMSDQENPLCEKIARSFISAVRGKVKET